MFREGRYHSESHVGSRHKWRELESTKCPLSSRVYFSWKCGKWRLDTYFEIRFLHHSYWSTALCVRLYTDNQSGPLSLGSVVNIMLGAEGSAWKKKHIRRWLGSNHQSRGYLSNALDDVITPLPRDPTDRLDEQRCFSKIFISIIL